MLIHGREHGVKIRVRAVFAQFMLDRCLAQALFLYDFVPLPLWIADIIIRTS